MKLKSAIVLVTTATAIIATTTGAASAQNVIDTTVGYANSPATDTQGVFLGASTNTSIREFPIHVGVQTVLDRHDAKMRSYGATLGIPMKLTPNALTLTPEVAVDHDRVLDKTTTAIGAGINYKIDNTVTANAKIHRVLTDKYKGEAYMFGVTKSW